MNIFYFSEMEFIGKIPRTFSNMRYEFSYMCALDATHYNLYNIPNEQSDMSILILPKDETKIEKIFENKNIDKIKQISKFVFIQQEGPFNYIQDYKIKNQFQLLNLINSVTGIFCHNENDKKYYSGLFKNKKTFTASSFLIEDEIKKIISKKEDITIIGGNFCKWYGGIDSFFVAKNFNTDVYCPSMGRKQQDEEKISGLKHLNFVNWLDWMKTLSKFKYAVHLMPTYAAGTFALNCAYFGIPCIGYDYVDTQSLLFPDLSIKYGDIEEANRLAIKLKNDKNFYENISNKSIENLKNNLSENLVIDRFNNFIQKIIDKQ